MDCTAAPPAWHGLVAGACSAVASRTCTYPPDTVKARLQVQGAGGTGMLYRGTVDAFAKIASREGLPGFYRGYGGILLTVIPANMCYFSGYEFGKRVSPKGLGLLGDMTTAVTAQTIASIVFCPIDIVKQRVQTQHVMQPGTSISPMAAVREVYRAAGVPGFFKGYLAMNALWLPWNLLYISLYEASKRRVYHWQLGRMGAAQGEVTQTADGMRVVVYPPMLHVLPLWTFPLCSSLSSAAASICTHPIDVIKTRLQVLANRGGGGSSGSGGSGGQQQQQLTSWQVCRQLYAEEGVRGFGRGMAARVATMSTGSAVTWMTYESVKRWLARRQQQEQEQQQQEEGAAGVAGALLGQQQQQQRHLHPPVLPQGALQSPPTTGGQQQQQPVEGPH